tara:strand:- start:1611 stop:2822 length:1212 start_codon:yes stop_codon:yes gene_type:complete
MFIKSKLHDIKESFKGKKMAPAFNAFHTFLFTPNDITDNGTHIKVADDLKRTMNTVIMSLVPCLIFGIFNAGYQHNIAIDAANGISTQASLFGNFLTFDNLMIGSIKVLPLVIVSYAVGLFVEFIFAVIKGHEVEEGYLVTGMLVPLIVPVDLPLWMLAVSVIFGVVIGKEVFGGTGMNILNPALTIRAFLFFAYPTWMSGDKVWVHDAVNRAGTPEAISGETILGSYAQNQDIIYSLSDMFFGYIPGSVGETSKILIIFGALFLIFSKIGSWRIILSTLIGALVMGLIFNGVIDSGLIDQSSKFYGLMSVPYWQHLLIGSILFGAVFMATDPVTAAQTNKGKWIYGFLIGFISIMIRVFNPAYPEGVFLAILLMNVFAPTIDHFVIQSNVKMRLNRLKIKSA